MSEFMLLFRGGDSRSLQQSAEAWQAHMQRWAEWMGLLAEQGRLLGAQPLHPTGKTMVGPQKLVTDGPYLEGKEMVGGYLMCKADSFDAALEVAKGCPILEFADGNVEVREIQQLTM